MGKLLLGVGFCDIRASEIVNGKQVRFNSYICWCGMITRCYDDKYQKGKPTYIGCSVSDEWLIYSNFKAWYDTNYVEGFALDKDLLIECNKEYSAETCTFVPPALNSLLTDSAANRGDFAIGVSFEKSRMKYRARCNANGSSKHIGYYSLPELASDAYQEFKRNYTLNEISTYRKLHPDNKKLMHLLNIMEDRIK